MLDNEPDRFWASDAGFRCAEIQLGRGMAQPKDSLIQYVDWGKVRTPTTY